MSKQGLKKSNSSQNFTNVSKGVHIINQIAAKYDKNTVLSADSLEPITMEDSDVIFHEIDIDNGGTVTVDELY